MRIHFLQHVPFETPGCVERWAAQRGYGLSGTALYADQPLPEPNAFDHLLVMGGPMGVHDESEYAWLTKEKHFIEKTVAAGKRIMGICLGAQLIAHVLGARVYQNPEKEIGWFEVTRTQASAEGTPSATELDIIDSGLPERFQAFHWHGDTFSLPPGARHLFQSAACRHQAFFSPAGILGLQFHLEITTPGILSLLENCGHELVDGRFIQDAATIRSQMALVPGSNRYMFDLLDAFFTLDGMSL